MNGSSYVAVLLGILFSSLWFWFISSLTSSHLCDPSSLLGKQNNLAQLTEVPTVWGVRMGGGDSSSRSPFPLSSRIIEGRDKDRQGRYKQNSDGNTSLSMQDVDSLFRSICPRYDSNLAVVIPLRASVDHLGYLESNLHRWSEHFPLLSKLDEGDQAKDSLYTKNLRAKLIFFLDGESRDMRVEAKLQEIWEKVKDQEEFEGGSKAKRKVGNCFDDVLILWGKLDKTRNEREKVENDQERNAKGEERELSVLQLDKIFEALSSIEVGVDYFFLMEPDCLPVRPGWLDKLYIESVCGQDFWVKGSPLRIPPGSGFIDEGSALPWMATRIHQNALYNVHDGDFFTIAIRAAKTRYPSLRPDHGLFMLLQDVLAVHYDHHYIHTDFIYDHYWPDEESEDDLLTQAQQLQQHLQQQQQPHQQQQQLQQKPVLSVVRLQGKEEERKAESRTKTNGRRKAKQDEDEDGDDEEEKNFLRQMLATSPNTFFIHKSITI